MTRPRPLPASDPAREGALPQAFPKRSKDTMTKKIKTAGVQLAPGPDRERNLAKAAMLVEVAANEGARIIALPQLFSLPWFPASIDRKNMAFAEEMDGPTVCFLLETAKRLEIVLIGSFFEVEGGRYFNTAIVAGPEGLIGKYRKVHVPQIPLWEERAYFSPGDLGFPVFDTPFGKLGVLLCWDIFFPEGFRILALKGAEMVFALTASAFEHSHKKWERAISAAAHANGFFVFRVNRVGREEKQEFYGKSFCCGPDGEMVDAPSGASEGVIVAEAALADVAAVRNEWVFLKDRRPGAYTEIAGAKE
ncbi:beta-ureidopropionase [uncultured bacterium]|nr:beta-ureidopropionase [uncultured bacterium]